MGKLIAFANAKGGVGKTMIAVHLAVFLKKAGYSVLMIDGDMNGESADWLVGIESEISCTGVLKKQDEIENQLRSAKKEADFVVVDCAGGMSVESMTVMFESDFIFIPCKPGGQVFNETLKAIRFIQEKCLRINPDLQAFVIPNELQKGKGDSWHWQSQQLLDLRDNLGTPFTKASLRFRIPYGAGFPGSLVWDLDHTAAEAKKELELLLKEIKAYVA